MTADFDAWLDARVMALAEDREAITVSEDDLYERVRHEIEEDARERTRRAMQEAFA